MPSFLGRRGFCYGTVYERDDGGGDRRGSCVDFFCDVSDYKRSKGEDMKNGIYGKTVVLKEPVFEVECWNFTDGSLHVLTSGSRLRVEHVHDETSTVVTLVDEKGGAPGVELVQKDGSKSTGYRFIVENVKLANATGLDMPAKTRNVVAEMMAWEQGELDEEGTLSLFQHLKDEGTLYELQGCYGREARRLGVV